MKNQKDKRNLSKLYLHSSSGITLVALVITIIVMLILAGVTLSMAIGENGIVESAVQAKKETTVATEREILSIEFFRNYDYVSNANSDTTSFESKEIEGGGAYAHFPDSGNEYIVDPEGNINSAESVENEDGSKYVYVPETGAEYIIETSGEMKNLYSETLYCYKYYTEEKGWSIRYMCGINTLDYQVATFKIQLGEYIAQHEETVVYDTVILEDGTEVLASVFDAKYIAVYTISGWTEERIATGMEAWLELPHLFSDGIFTTNHFIADSLDDIPDIEELIE